MDPHRHIPGAMPQPLLEEYRRRMEALQRSPAPDQDARTQPTDAKTEAQQQAWCARLRDATDLDEIVLLLDEINAPYAKSAKGIVDATWRRLSDAGAFGPPSHDIAIVRCHWPVFGKPQRLVFEELSRQPGWLALNAQPFCFREGTDARKEARGRMDVWIAADGQTFRREEVYRGDPHGDRVAHDATLSYYLRNDARRRPVPVAVLPGDPPRTEEVSGFLRPRETKALLNTTLLTTEGSRDSHSLDHNLGTALAAVLRTRRQTGCVHEP